MKLKNKVALVTGSSRGIGKEVAILFAKEGASVIINHFKSEKEAKEVFKETSKNSEGMLIECDASNEKDVKKMIESIVKKFGKIDILVNNVDKYIEGDEWNGSSETWEKTLKDNLVSAMNVSKYVVDIFLKQKSGIMVNISSRYSTSGQSDALAYSAAKAGLVNITQAYSRLLAPFGRANVISPGPVNVGYWLRAPKEELEKTLATLRDRRLIDPKDVANRVFFLVTDESKNITGQNIMIN